MTESIRSGQDAKRRWQHLCDQPQEAARWSWYALMRLIQSADPDKPRLGYSLRLEEDPVRLGQPPFFHPPGVEVAALKKRGPQERDASGLEDAQLSDAATFSGRRDPYRHQVPWLYAYQMGLFGPFGPLPLHLTELAHSRDPALSAFCDVLHHRFITFFFRAWADSRKETDLDRAPPSDPGRASSAVAFESWSGGERMWELYFCSLIGHGTPALRRRNRIPDHAKCYYAGRLMQPMRNAEGLCALLADYFQIPSRILSFVPRVFQLPDSVRCRLGGRNRTDRLGLSTLIGASYKDCQLGFRIRLGPMTLKNYEEFLPGSDGFRELHDWISLYTGLEQDPDTGMESVWELQLVLRGPEVPRLQLSPSREAGQRLGHTSWLGCLPRGEDEEAADLILRPAADLAEKRMPGGTAKR